MSPPLKHKTRNNAGRKWLACIFQRVGVMRNHKRDSHIFEKDPLGHYVEPEWCSRRLFEAESFGAPSARILDPAAGWGRIPRAAIAAGYTAIASDIVDRRGDRLSDLAGIEFHACDFLEHSPVSRPWSIVSNPPFDDVEEFCARALEITTFKVAVLVPLRRLPAAHWLARITLESIYLLTPRPSMPPGSWIEAGNRPSGGSQDFCWLVFNKRSPAIAPRVRWLHRAVKAPKEGAVS
jgi:hypothetical protein